MLRNIPSSVLRQLVKLSERRESLLAQIQNVDREIVRLEGRFGVPATDDRATVALASKKFTSESADAKHRAALYAKE